MGSLTEFRDGPSGRRPAGPVTHTKGKAANAFPFLLGANVNETSVTDPGAADSGLLGIGYHASVRRRDPSIQKLEQMSQPGLRQPGRLPRRSDPLGRHRH